MPRRETRYDIERALFEERRKRRALRPDVPHELQAEIAREMARQRKVLGQHESVEIHVRNGKIVVKKSRRRRRPGDGSMPVPVEPPRGPRPFAGGAAASLEFD